MEFQAGYIGGALLMPKSELSIMAAEIGLRESEKPPLRVDSELGRAAIERIMRRCQVSEQAARVRLFRLGLLTES